jgi:hypothetical protein
MEALRMRREALTLTLSQMERGLEGLPEEEGIEGRSPEKEGQSI